MQQQYTVCIMYGIGEGRWHGKRLRKALTSAGFRLISKAEEADIIVSHSGGCFFLPRTPPDQMIVLINPPFWPGKPLIVSVFQKIWWDFKAFARRGKVLGWLFKTAWNTVHLVRYLGVSLTISLKARKRNFYTSLHQDYVVIIRNDQDAWCTPDIQKVLEPHRIFPVHTLPGQHDDCWADPGPYVEVIQSELTAWQRTRSKI